LHSTRSLGVEAGLSLLLVLVHLRYRSMLTVAGEPWRRLSDHRSDGDLGEAFAAAFRDHDWRYESVLQLPERLMRWQRDPRSRCHVREMNAR